MKSDLGDCLKRSSDLIVTDAIPLLFIAGDRGYLSVMSCDFNSILTSALNRYHIWNVVIT